MNTSAITSVATFVIGIAEVTLLFISSKTSISRVTLVHSLWKTTTIVFRCGNGTRGVSKRPLTVSRSKRAPPLSFPCCRPTILSQAGGYDVKGRKLQAIIGWKKKAYVRKMANVESLKRHKFLRLLLTLWWRANATTRWSIVIRRYHAGYKERL